MNKPKRKTTIWISRTYLQNKKRSPRKKCTVECSPSMVMHLMPYAFTKDTVVKHPNQDSRDRFEVIYVD
ncbi:MAG: hypothetical protein NTV31_07920 [Bacteroidia bacterium]|nr:hypothetical protein [Bacteroidia bacterium]